MLTETNGGTKHFSITTLYDIQNVESDIYMVIETRRRRRVKTEIFDKENPFKKRTIKKIFVEETSTQT